MKSIKNKTKGDWSELYVLGSLLSDGKLNIADENLDKLEDTCYEINKLITSAESPEKIIYTIHDGDLSILDPFSGKEEKIKRSVIKNKILSFLNELKEKQTISLVVGKEIKKLLRVKRISQTSRHKADLMIESYDSRTRRVTESGYSIKSQIGAASTLFNASQATNLEFQILGIKKDQVDKINEEVSCRERVKKIYELGNKLVYQNTNDIFRLNLMMVDANFPNILAEAVLIFYKSDYRALKDIIFELNKVKIIDLQIEEMNYYLKNNFKKFLLYSALGMVAKTRWNGTSTATGGIIVVKKDGEILGYTPYNVDLFQEYLISNTRFDSPDSDRNKYGKIYQVGNNFFIKLNFQIRFIN